MASLLSRLFGFHKKTIDPPFERPSYPLSPLAKASLFPQPPAPEATSVLQPVKNWCHPFKDKGDQLSQLTHMANATGGYFPIGRSGLFHGGVHFDSGTGVTPDKPVHCLADGEVVAYRVDTEFPTTRYFVNDITVNKPFSRNFVLVRHRLQPPKIQGSSDVPPSLIFYSLYMHLQEWAEYDNDFKLPRPAFWPESETLLVKPTVSDVRPGPPEQRGLNVFNKLRNGQVIDLLLPGTKVRVSGTGRKRRLENSLGPAEHLSADGSLPGYISASLLKPIVDNEYQIVSSRKTVNVRPEPNTLKKPLFELFSGSEITVSGEGDFRKLERIHQYVDFNELQAERKPLALDQVVVLDKPVPIMAGDLIGHLGKYQDMGTDRPEHRLHLEVFTGDQIDLFLEASRAWAQRLPAKTKTWLKLAKGTPVVPHQDNLTGAQLKIMSADSPVSAADLLIPKKRLDELAADRKIHMPANPAPTASNWYRLEGLLHDANNNSLYGWVREEIGVTPWLSPWSWEGYDIIFDYGRPKHAMAAYFSAINRFNDAQRERFRPLAEEDNKGPMKSRLYDIIDRDRNGHITAEELRAAMRLPAHAQAISQMIVRKESEWFYKTPKWDALDELLGHSGSTPHLNWVAEKQRIEEMSWWGDVAGKVGLSAMGKAFHFHPVGLVGCYMDSPYKVTVDLIEKVTGKTGSWFKGRGGGSAFTLRFPENYPKIFEFDKHEFIELLNNAFERYGIVTPYQQAHFIAQCFHESAHFETTVEFATGDGYDPGAHSGAIANGNTEIGDGRKYKGKGLIQLTWKNNYRAYSNFKNADFVANPNLIAENMDLAIDVSCWFWRNKGAIYQKHGSKGDINVLIDKEPFNVGLVTLAVNGGNNGLNDRVAIFGALMNEWGLSK